MRDEYIKGKKIYSSNFRQTFSSSFPQTKPLTKSAALLRAAQVLPLSLLAAGAACAWSAASNVIIKSFDKFKIYVKAIGNESVYLSAFVNDIIKPLTGHCYCLSNVTYIDNSLQKVKVALNLISQSPPI